VATTVATVVAIAVAAVKMAVAVAVVVAITNGAAVADGAAFSPTASGTRNCLRGKQEECVPTHTKTCTRGRGGGGRRGEG
jgi:hypothetical protein